MNDRTVIIVIIIAIFSLYLLGNYLGITGEIVHNRYCVDSDDYLEIEDSIYVAGNVESDIGRFSDRCNTGLKGVREYYCVEGYLGGMYQVRSRIIECGFGYSCERDVVGNDDACVSA